MFLLFAQSEMSRLGIQRKTTEAIINRNSLSKDGFSYMLWVAGRAQEKGIKFADIFSAQEKALLDELGSILKTIKKVERDHKATFADELLSSFIPDGETHSFSLLRQIAYDELAWVVFLNFKKKYELVKLRIEARYGPIKQTLRVPGTMLLIAELDRIFFKIEELKGDTGNVEIDIGIYADALVEKLKELKTHLNEIDDEFKVE